MIGLRIRQVRDLLGWTQKKLESESGVDQGLLSRIEAGAEPKPETLAAIAAATGYPPSWFLRPMSEFPDGTVQFRKKAAATQRADRRARRRLEVSVELVDAALGDTGLSIPQVRFPLLDPPQNLDDIEAAAQTMRDRLGLSARGPVPHMMRALERAGAIVVPLDGDLEHHDGLSVWPDPDGGRPIIGFKSEMPGDRLRFTLAHEAGHLAMHRHGVPDGHDAELEANQFAGALLMPRHDAIKAFEGHTVTLRYLANLKAQWGIAIQALIKRAAAIGAIDKEREQLLFRQVGARGWRKNEPVQVDQEEPALIRRILERAYPDSRPNDIAQTLDFPLHLLVGIAGAGRQESDDGAEVLTLDDARRPATRRASG
jgi:Zn-dependent peptidase ImmA (M78 family)